MTIFNSANIDTVLHQHICGIKYPASLLCILGRNENRRQQGETTMFPVTALSDLETAINVSSFKNLNSSHSVSVIRTWTAGSVELFLIPVL